MKKNKFIIYLRWGLLALFTMLITVASYLHQALGGGRVPSIHALCPFGGLESLYTFFTTGNYIGKIFSGTMILFAITLVLTIVFRRSFCGILCPLGAIQEFFAGIGRKIFRRRFVIPQQYDKPFRYAKYVILLITVLYAWRMAGLWMAPYDPWSAYAHLSEGPKKLWEETPVALIILIITVIGSLLYDRFFCKYLCPMGAFNGIVGKISPFKVVRNQEKCIDCNHCTRECPVNIDVAKSKEVTTAECINCQTCVLHCPAAGALELKEGKQAVRPLTAIVMIVALFFVPILVTQSLGIYQMLPEKIRPGQSIKLSEVRGYMTIQEAAETAKIGMNEFYRKFKIPENVPATTIMKKIGDVVPGYNFEKVKEGLDVSTGASGNTGSPETNRVNVQRIIGSMTIEEAAESISIGIKEYYQLFKIPETVRPETKMKEIKNTVPGYDFHKVKDALK
jgi:polyferredoxin